MASRDAKSVHASAASSADSGGAAAATFSARATHARRAVREYPCPREDDRNRCGGGYADRLDGSGP
jgi:hypothetical protein